MSQSNLRAKTCAGFSLACNEIAFLFFAFYSFSGGQFMASNGWTLIPIYLNVSKFSYINRILLVQEHNKICYQWQTGWLKTSTLGKITIYKEADYGVPFPPKFNVPFYIVLCIMYPTFCVCHLSLHSRFNFFASNIQLWFMQHSSFRFRHSTFHKQ